MSKASGLASAETITVSIVAIAPGEAGDEYLKFEEMGLVAYRGRGKSSFSAVVRAGTRNAARVAVGPVGAFNDVAILAFEVADAFVF